MNLGDGAKLAFESERLVRWGGWLIEYGKMTLPWMKAQLRQANERQQEAQAEYDRLVAEDEEVMDCSTACATGRA